ncbi:deoxynucleotide monophosphate kinase family protein [Mesorhizobium sp. NZP2298]|uniref:deoxynucleotide monophosphate kinase family protein n=1 Tax=Mesorhizobium sp. NZP2298 TaxID=2483403 RepID=UPI0015531865|nr:deoxynucleotide monophosphate kinase [Mesorhizobium sp. NZP2298]QKC99150.1 deoxynucleotide monophosphate kinase [Mesorhizobium sp. NZP2298]
MTGFAEFYTPWGFIPANDNVKPPPASHYHHNVDKLPLIVALSGVAGSGKSTVAEYLQDIHGYTRVRFAGPLKAAMAALGLSAKQIEGDLKEVPCDLLCGHTPRYAMQTIGTEWGRNIIGEEFWTGLWRAAANAVIEDGGRVVVDDCRFPNEAATVRKMGGDIYRIIGRGGLAGAHESERMDFIPDIVISNESDILALYSKVDEALVRWG